MLLLVATPGRAATDLGVEATGFSISSSGGKQKVGYTAKDREAGISKGSSIDPTRISVRLDYAYVGGPAGAFIVPEGASSSAAVPGWRTNSAKKAKFVNKQASGGPTGARVLLVQPGRSLKLAARSTGDVALDPLAAGPPSAGVITIFTVTNDGETFRHCTLFENCAYRMLSGGEGARLSCRSGVPTACGGATTTTSTSTTTSSTTTSTHAPPTTTSTTSTTSTSTTTSTSSTTTTTSTSTSTTTTTTLPGMGRVTKAVQPTTLYEISTAAMTPAERTMIATLQGIVSRHSAEQIYIHPHVGGYETWLADLAANYGVARIEVSDPWWLVDHFSAYVSGYLLWQGGDSSVNAATSLAGIEEALAVETSIEADAIAAGLALVGDLRGLDEAWVLANYADDLNRLAAFEQKEGFDLQLRDYGVLSGALFFYDGNSAWRDTVADFLDEDAMTYGWGDATLGEDTFVGASSDRGVFTLAADHAHNLAPLSGIPATPLLQATHDTPTAETGVHYVAFLMSDGDNVQWLLGDFPVDGRWFGSADRGSFDMGYGIAPILAELAPSVLAWYYEQSSTAPGRDFFVVGPSGGGYFYPSRYPAAALAAQTTRLAGWMGLADLNLVQILDFGAFESTYLWDDYTEHDEIDGLFYLEYADYSDAHGRVGWSGGKPVIGARTKLWEGLADSDAASVTNRLNAGLLDPTSPEGYSLVSVAAWSESVTKVKNIVDALDADVRVVTPGALAHLIRENVPHEVVVQHDYVGVDFATAEMALVGDAFWATDNDALLAPHPQRLRLTGNAGGLNGAAWGTSAFDPSQSWTSTFRFQISYPASGGADGLAFVVQSDGLSANPGYLGASGNPSLAVVIDTWNNGEGTDESLKVLVGGSQVFFNDLLDLAADPTPGSLPHVFRMELSYLAATHQLRIVIDDEGGTAWLDNTATVDLDGSGASYAGFAATTGGSAENHDIRTWTFYAAAP